MILFEFHFVVILLFEGCLSLPAITSRYPLQAANQVQCHIDTTQSPGLTSWPHHIFYFRWMSPLPGATSSTVNECSARCVPQLLPISVGGETTYPLRWCSCLAMLERSSKDHNRVEKARILQLSYWIWIVKWHVRRIWLLCYEAFLNWILPQKLF